MKGLLKSKSAGSQFVVFISIAVVCLVLLGAIGALILTSVTGIKLTEINDASKMDFSKSGTIDFLRGMQIVQFISLFLIPTFLCATLFSTNTKQYLGLKKPSSNFYFIVAVAAMVISIPLVTWLGELNQQIQFPKRIAEWMRAGEEDAAKTVKGLLSKHTIKDLILNIICIAGLAAVGEELLFRGMLQRLLIKMFRNPLPGIIITAILFSAMHMQFYGFIPRFALGVLLGAVYWYSGSLWVAMLAHFMYDGLLIVLAYFNPSMLNEENSAKASNLALIGTVSFVCVVLLLQWMRKKSVTTYTAVYADDSKAVKDNPFDFE